MKFGSFSTWQNSVWMTNALFALCPATRWWCHVFTLPRWGPGLCPHMLGGGVGGRTVNSPGVCAFIYCWEMLIVATAFLCVGTEAVPVLHHGLKTAAGNEEKKGRGRNGRERKRGKHFRKERHGTQTRRPLKPADNPADWFGHIRDGTEQLAHLAERDM